MFAFTPSLDSGEAATNLAKLLTPRIEPAFFRYAVPRLTRMFAAAVNSSSPPWPASGLNVTREINYQSELWLPLEIIRPVFERFYSLSLTYPPVFSSTPFTDGTSWAAIVSAMPAFFGHSADPARLLERLVTDEILRLKFLIWSFMPQRFYGDGCDRYPGQTDFLHEWLGSRRRGPGQLRCLDAASGDGAATYGLAGILLMCGWMPEQFAIEGWTLDPLEAWTAAHATFPHDPDREALFRKRTALLFDHTAARSMIFRQADLLQSPVASSGFDVIKCNGLLGGPIVNRCSLIRTIVANLVLMLRPGGILLAADRFHGGWKRNIPGETLGDVFVSCGLEVVEAGEGPAGVTSSRGQ